MITLLIYWIETMRRALKRGNRHMFSFATAFFDSIEDGKKSALAHPFAE